MTSYRPQFFDILVTLLVIVIFSSFALGYNTLNTPEPIQITGEVKTGVISQVSDGNSVCITRVSESRCKPYEAFSRETVQNGNVVRYVLLQIQEKGNARHYVLILGPG